MNLVIKHNLAQLNEDIRRYQKYSGKTSAETLWRQGSELGWNLYRRLRTLTPEKGAIRADALKRLGWGQGIQVRPTVRARVYSKRQARSDIGTQQVIFGRGRGAATLKRKGSRLNLQSLAIEAEINVREKARGFLAVSSVRPRRGSLPTRGVRAWSKFGPILAEAKFLEIKDAATLSFSWGESLSPLSESAATGLHRARAQAAIASSLSDTSSNITTYLERKLAEGVKTFR